MKVVQEGVIEVSCVVLQVEDLVLGLFFEVFFWVFIGIEGLAVCVHVNILVSYLKILPRLCRVI